MVSVLRCETVRLAYGWAEPPSVSLGAEMVADWAAVGAGATVD
jgi:hypothetical protein